MGVVTTAMITSVAKTPSEMTPRGRPMLMMISSISPRAFLLRKELRVMEQQPR